MPTFYFCRFTLPREEVITQEVAACDQMDSPIFAKVHHIRYFKDHRFRSRAETLPAAK